MNKIIYKMYNSIEPTNKLKKWLKRKLYDLIWEEYLKTHKL